MTKQNISSYPIIPAGISNFKFLQIMSKKFTLIIDGRGECFEEPLKLSTEHNIKTLLLDCLNFNLQDFIQKLEEIEAQVAETLGERFQKLGVMHWTVGYPMIGNPDINLCEESSDEIFTALVLRGYKVRTVPPALTKTDNSCSLRMAEIIKEELNQE